MSIDNDNDDADASAAVSADVIAANDDDDYDIIAVKYFRFIENDTLPSLILIFHVNVCVFQV